MWPSSSHASSSALNAAHTVLGAPSLLEHVQITMCNGKLQVRATVGALVGPPWSRRQNGWHFAEEDGITVYYEPHANHDLQSVKSVSPVDFAIIPAESAYVAGMRYWCLWFCTASYQSISNFTA